MTTEFTVASLNYFSLLYRKGQPIHQVKGKLKEIAEELNDNPELKAEGTGEKLAGKVQEKIGQIKKVFGK